MVCGGANSINVGDDDVTSLKEHGRLAADADATRSTSEDHVTGKQLNNA
jgi:hypothetical protein